MLENETIQRRQFLQRSLAATAAVGTTGWTTARAAATSVAERECYERRTFETPDEETRQLMLSYLANGLLPALNRQGVDRIGVFTEIGGENKSPSTSRLFAIVKERK